MVGWLVSWLAGWLVGRFGVVVGGGGGFRPGLPRPYLLVSGWLTHFVYRRVVAEEGDCIIIYITLHCHHQNDSRIKMGSDESRFQCFVSCEGQSHKDSVHKLQLLKKKESRTGFEPWPVLLLTIVTPYR